MTGPAPWMKFYPQDWRADEKLRMCSLAARGLWIEMVALMHRSEKYGTLLINGIVPTDAQVAMQVGAEVSEVSKLLSELEAAGVFSRTGTQAIYSRRMKRDEKKAKNARNNGKKGGNPKLSKTRENPASDNPEDKGRDKAQIPEARDQILERGKENKSLSSRALPEWLPSAEWDGFKAMRTKIKKPLTDRAATMAIRKLGELRDEGHDPAAVLDQSTLHCWQDLYALKARQIASGYGPGHSGVPL
jgi:hypothetical protein